MGYVTGTDIDNASYVSITDLSSMGYVTSNDLPVIDKSIVPKENNTYTLGNASNLYAASYTKATYLNNTDKIYDAGNGRIGISVNNYGGFRFGPNQFYPYGENSFVGTSSNKWGYAYINNIYTSNLYLGSSNIKDLINGMFSYDSNTGTLTITTIS